MQHNVKNEQEIQIMRKAAKILADTLSYVQTIAKPGVTTLFLDQKAEEFILDHNALPAFKGFSGFPCTLCTSVNEQVVHTIPSKQVLKDGDIITVDAGVKLDGYNTDSATTFGIGNIDQNTEQFIEKVREILYGAIKLVKPGTKTGDIGAYIMNETKNAGFHIFKELIGHGIGKSLHEEPEIPNFGKQGKGTSLVPGMTICIEPIVGYSTNKMITLDDEWCIITKDGGLSCQQEHTILVTQSGFEILTLREEEKANFKFF
jgi:methionyl aminopeptidase